MIWRCGPRQRAHHATEDALAGGERERRRQRKGARTGVGQRVRVERRAHGTAHQPDAPGGTRASDEHGEHQADHQRELQRARRIALRLRPPICTGRVRQSGERATPRAGVTG